MPALTETPAPAVTPTGGGNSRIAYFTRGMDLTELWIMEADGSNKTQLTDEVLFEPEWSPDGSKIVFSSFELDTPYINIWTINVDGSGEVELSDGVDDFYRLQWLPAGAP